MSRAHNIIPSGIIAAIGIWVAYVSYTQSPAEAFLFPRLIATAFVVLALWTFAKACMGLSRTGDGISMEMAKNILPGLVVMCLYVFVAAKGLGFYTATTATVFALITLYDPTPLSSLKGWGKRILITAVFMAVLYGLFAGLLTVFTPREIFA